MTIKQAGPVAMRAGYNAYYAAFSTGHFGANHKPHQQNPPYPKNPQRIQWIRGWQFGQKNYESGGQFSYDPFKGVELGNLGREPFDKQKAQREQQRKQAEFHAKQKVKTSEKNLPFAVTKPYPKVFKLKLKDNVQAEPGAVNLKRLDKFNKKYRTKV